ncbi:uncharacterized protein [Rutidosis leptorrhynchoides]|uniref:uncharacterized protein n=1 Tax=Rutidosis leptorrhynchoides TaxID=125765 RepID=UPI003A9A3387
MTSMTTAAKEHVAEIRRTKFSIGGEPNPLTEDLHQAVKNLSAELYAKDVHFLMELIQNAEDNEYPEGVDPSLEFVVTSKDITDTGAPATLLVFNNEKGFSRKNIESICSVGRSTKKGLRKRKRGYIGEKGIGFKSVFLITSQPYIFSNGYKIRFNEKPCQLCNVGYIVPEWVEDESILSSIRRIYGSTSTLPTTALVLPLKPDKFKPAKDQLSTVHPEVLLFLSKIKRLSVKENNEDPKLNTVSAISISSEKNFVTQKSMDAESYTLYLTADDTTNKDDTECDYYMWKQRFPVKNENRVDVRSDVEEWAITLAFPNGERLKRGSSMPGIYSFLPTETVTNFPFIIQADFLLASSRENILWDNKWNKGILDCVPVAFMNAFTSLLKSTNNAPISSLPNMFRFLPVNSSSHPKLDNVRDTIKTKIMKEPIVPCESYAVQKLFCKPVEVFKLKPAFWSILNRARNEGVSFQNISSHGAYAITSYFDKPEYGPVLEFLEIKDIDYDWYARCIASSNLVMGVSEHVYIDLLVFIAEDWGQCFNNTEIDNIPLIKYAGLDGQVKLFKINACKDKILVANSDYIPWLINWNREFHCSTQRFFLPKATRDAIRLCSKQQILYKWLREDLKVKFVGVNEYAMALSSSIGSDRKLAVTFAHFVYNSLQKKYLQKHEVEALCGCMPIVDNYGQVNTSRTGVLVPANGSKWVELIGSNPWRQDNYVELGEDYTRRANYIGTVTSGEKIISFLKDYVSARDVPNLAPPNSAIPTLSSPLTKRNAFLLLEWIHKQRMKGVSLPEKFLSSIKNGSWLKISLSGCSGYKPPNESFMLDASIGKLLQNGSVLVDIPLIDVSFYGNVIKSYKEELQLFGVRFENKEACEYIGDRLMTTVASSKLTRDNAISILKFIQYLRANYISSKDFIDRIKNGKWLRTSRGDVAPRNAVLYNNEWNAASQISDIPFIDKDYYGYELHSFKTELELMGVVVSFDQRCYQLVYDNLKSSSLLTCLSSEAVYMMLKCVANLSSSTNLVEAVKGQKILMTNMGYRCPPECFLLNSESEWGDLLRVFNSFLIVDESFYGQKIFALSTELQKLGVIVTFEDASKEFVRTFKQQASSITKENVFLLLDCYKKMRKMNINLPSELSSCLRDEKWLRTKLGDYRSPCECILFGKDWEPISSISLLPFIDDSDSFYGSRINDYKDELKLLKVIDDFKDGAKLVAAGVILPHDCSTISSVSVFALLDTVKQLEDDKSDTRTKFFEKLSRKKWIKTYLGYKRPGDCLLFNSAWDRVIKRTDGPFIDEEFYGSRIASYKDQLNLLKVVTDVNNGCQLLASYLDSHSCFESIKRIYNYLSEYSWKPEEEFDKKIWIPRGTKNGEWVTPQQCVVHDKNNLFGDELNVLEKCKYEKNLLSFFANVFDVKVHPTVDDYCELWKKWESSGRQITHTKCCSFWKFVVGNWTSETEDTFISNISKLPVLDSTSDGIFLLLKSDVFIGDDLFLADLFQKTSHPMFVWYPQQSSKNLNRTKLMDIYRQLGVRTLSECVKKTISGVDPDKLKPMKSKKQIIKKGLFKLILGFLADPSLKLDVERRHEAVNRLLAVEAFETVEPMNVGYSLSFSSGVVVRVEARRMVRWDKQNSKFFMQKMVISRGYKNAIEHASHFAEVIADGVLWDNEEFVPKLSELIRRMQKKDTDQQQMVMGGAPITNSGQIQLQGNQLLLCTKKTINVPKEIIQNFQSSSVTNEVLNLNPVMTPSFVGSANTTNNQHSPLSASIPPPFTFGDFIPSSSEPRESAGHLNEILRTARSPSTVHFSAQQQVVDINSHFAAHSSSSCKNTVFVGRLENTVTPHMLEATFGKFGSLTEIKFWPSRRYSFVSFTEDSAASSAVIELNGSKIFGKPIFVGWPRKSKIGSFGRTKQVLFPKLRCKLSQNATIVQQVNLSILLLDLVPIDETKISSFLISCKAHVAHVSKFGPYGCICICGDVESYNNIINSRSKEFVLIAPFSGAANSFHRYSWIEITGVPVTCASEDNASVVANLFGDSIFIADASSTLDNVGSLFAFIRSINAKHIHDSVEADLESKDLKCSRCNVWVSEVSEANVLNCVFNDVFDKKLLESSSLQSCKQKHLCVVIFFLPLSFVLTPPLIPTFFTPSLRNLFA